MSRRNALLWIFLLLTLVCLAVIGIALQLFPVQSNPNLLAIRGDAKTEMVDLEIHSLAELDFKTKEDIWALRSAAVNHAPELLVNPYQPSEAVFGQIVDGLPWWGVLGAYYYGSGEKSIEGPAEHSISILNPFLLAVPEFYIHWPASVLTVSSPFILYRNYFCEPEYLRWHPSAGWAEAGYSGACLQKNDVSYFSVIAYNARDLNLNYIYISLQDSTNFSQPGHSSRPYKNPQFLHQGGSCGYPGGCNNVSPATPILDDLRISNFPARLVLWFWQDKPRSAETTPDFVFILDFSED